MGSVKASVMSEKGLGMTIQLPRGLPPFSEKRAKICAGGRAEVAIGLGLKGRAIPPHLPLSPDGRTDGRPLMKCRFGLCLPLYPQT